MPAADDMGAALDNVTPMRRRAPPKAKAPPTTGALPDDATHAAIAEHWLSLQPPPAPIYAEGNLHAYAGGIWTPVPIEHVHVDIGRRYALKNCRRRADYLAVAAHVQDLAADPAAFEAPLFGVQGPGGFWRVDARQIVRTDSAPELRQRFRIEVDPDPAPADQFDEFLDAAFRNDDMERTIAQQRLLQEIIGAALVGVLWRYQLAVLFYGNSSSGKSVLLHILEALFPQDFVRSVSPFDWDREYSRAVLAGCRLNLCGELPNDRDIPAREFKQIIGGDRIDARHPYGRPFDFIARCAHVFSSNWLPPTRDTHHAFWRRWVCFGFYNSVAPADQDHDLPARIVRDELAQIVGWAMEGARRVLERGRFTPSPVSGEILDRWRLAADAVAEFLADPEAVRRDDDASTPRADVYEGFRQWCKDAERKPVGRRKFYERVEALGLLAGKDAAGQRFIHGVGLVK